MQEWLDRNPVPTQNQTLIQNWMAEAFRQWLCTCGCTEDELRQLLQYFQNLSCPDNPLPVRDCLSQAILEQLQQINANTDELEVTAQNIYLEANQINLNTDEVEALLAQIRDRLLAAVCGNNPLGTEVCNASAIVNPIVTAINNLLTLFSSYNCPGNPLRVQDCNSADALAQLQDINANTDQLEPLVTEVRDRLVLASGTLCDGVTAAPQGVAVTLQNVPQVRICPGQSVDINNIPTATGVDCAGGPSQPGMPVVVRNVINTRACPDQLVTALDCQNNPVGQYTGVAVAGVATTRHCDRNIRWRQRALTGAFSFDPTLPANGPVRGLELVVVTGSVDVTGPVAGDGTINYPAGTYQISGQDTFLITGNVTFTPLIGTVAFIRWAQQV